jgi:hypothetical protein
MIPPLMSSTLSGEDILGNSKQANSGKTQNTTGKDNAAAQAGRPAKEESAKSDKTI